MRVLMTTCALSTIYACSGDIPVSLNKKPTAWKLKATSKINQLEMGIWIIGLVLAMMLVLALVSKFVYTKKKTRYRLRTEFMQSDENRNLRRETYL